MRDIAGHFLSHLLTWAFYLVIKDKGRLPVCTSLPRYRASGRFISFHSCIVCPGLTPDILSVNQHTGCVTTSKITTSMLHVWTPVLTSAALRSTGKRNPAALRVHTNGISLFMGIVSCVQRSQGCDGGQIIPRLCSSRWRSKKGRKKGSKSKV